jgi:hypothetical protein
MEITATDRRQRSTDVSKEITSGASCQQFVSIFQFSPQFLGRRSLGPLRVAHRLGVSDTSGQRFSFLFVSHVFKRSKSHSFVLCFKLVHFNAQYPSHKRAVTSRMYPSSYFSNLPTFSATNRLTPSHRPVFTSTSAPNPAPATNTSNAVLNADRYRRRRIHFSPPVVS